MLCLAAALFFQTACSDSGADTSRVDTPTPTQVAEATPPPVPSPTLPPGLVAPEPGLPCPIQASVCEFAIRLFPIIAAGDVDAFLALTEPVPVVCRGTRGIGGPSAALCADAAIDETRFGYWDTRAGEGLAVTEAEFRSKLERWFNLIPQARGEDEYGPGALRVGSVACARLHSEPAGVCGKGWLLVHFTLISPAADPSQGVGIPGERTTFHVSLHEGADGELRINGFGQSVPSNATLEAFSLDAQTDTGEIVLLEFYPWTP
jgi:hypothetical protein